MARIYLAALYSEKLKMRTVRDRIVAAGHIVTSRWIDNPDDENALSRRDNAHMDLDDVRAACTLLAFSLPRGQMHNGGGRHVEFGVAVERNMRIVVVGPHGEHVFHALDGVVAVPTVDRAIEFLTDKRNVDPDDWRRMSIALRKRWWKETDYGRAAPSQELLDAIRAAGQEPQENAQVTTPAPPA